MARTRVKAEDTREMLMAFVSTYSRGHGYPPTVREIQDALALASTSTVQHHIRVLVADGRITTLGNSARTIRVVKQETHVTD